MSSELRAPAQVPANKLYVNIAAIQSSIFLADGTNRPTWLADSFSTINGGLSTLGAAVLRDMGKTVYLPASSTSALRSSVLRKVQLVTPASVSGPAGVDGEFCTGYIEIGGLTYGGGNGTPAKVARLN